MRKIFLATVTLVFFLGTTPVLAQIAGSWEGTGTGSCPPPFSSPSRLMYPWHDWTGEIPTDEETFSGEWQDDWGFHGTFSGESTIGTPDEAVFTGTWTVENDDEIYEMGTFYMHFPYASRECHGEWITYDSDFYQGTMSGHRVN